MRNRWLYPPDDIRNAPSASHHTYAPASSTMTPSQNTVDSVLASAIGIASVGLERCNAGALDLRESGC